MKKIKQGEEAKAMGAVVVDQVGGRVFWEVVILSRELNERRMSEQKASEVDRRREKQG